MAISLQTVRTQGFKSRPRLPWIVLISDSSSLTEWGTAVLPNRKYL